ncbi:Metallophosphoesterase [Trichormus variabilis ATCC 29413]|uniref:Metallophosphoesterase n=2 Tax=Anabaena variabilis TaxID=264691 RepID=Q3M5P0_TRIV2|nr:MULTISPECIES: metallophosphoesterase family protein [Nostocaceae]ABA23696.1 Metallophosphoesterase [Trichormus variabilis ATCC 29413]MBC1213143.1 serine/threonine protein phosphatase [Trichormus variabilis ARAD]MBC1253984.1 serine/threonine protein phosphatase [Trichormus variabilis V5]MBC1265573.1 serine/threonine protein phosphatase [Trichormus variabilis FSR]MBC1301756.1 serine/threonine protein phosphatase [Trichormus variabilis N2B]
MRTIVVGDIHGCYAELLQLLAKVEIAEEDCLVSLGDIVDRGIDSVKVYDFLKNRPNTIVLMGNHERKHLRQTLSYSQEIVKLQFGDSYDEFLEWISHLPYYHETESAIFVHAAVEDGIPIEEQREEVLCGCTAGEKHLGKRYGDSSWSQLYTGVKPVIFGHRVVGDHPLIIPQKTYGIDTGACHGGTLTAIILPSFEIVQVQAAKDYWQEEIVKWQLPVMKAKPWGSYKWEKIQAICDEFRNSANSELSAFIAQKEQWMYDLLALAPKIILKVEEKLAELISVYGNDGFKKPARCFTYATLLYQANASNLTSKFLQQALPTPDKWLQIMKELEV